MGNSRALLNLLVLVLIIIAIPFTVIVAQNQQTVKQEATTYKQPAVQSNSRAGLKIGTFDPKSISSQTHRIGVRQGANGGEFYNKETGEKFIPRGNNYIKLRPYIDPLTKETITVLDTTFNPEYYNKDKNDIEAALTKMEQDGYNILRVPINSGVIGNPNGSGLSSDYLDNVTDFLIRAKKHNIYIALTLGSIPHVGGYWTKDNSLWNHNWYMLYKDGIDAQKKYHKDIINGLLSRNAPFDIIFSYSLYNEAHFQKHQVPLDPRWLETQSNKMFKAANGVTYDLSDPVQRSKMMDASLVYWINELRANILTLDSTALVGVGFFAPKAVEDPNNFMITRTYWGIVNPEIGGSSADYVDLHLYPGWGVSMKEYIDSFEIESAKKDSGGKLKKPIFMGEFGAHKDQYSNAANGAVALKDWQVESCKYGFQGWLLWVWDEPLDVIGHYSALYQNGAINGVLAPVVRADPCSKENIAPTSIPTLTPTPYPKTSVNHRIGVRQGANGGEFYNKETGEKFIPRGNNYIRLGWIYDPWNGEQIYHSTFDPKSTARRDNPGYEPNRAKTALEKMKKDGYNIVRVFISDSTVGSQNGGLSQDYLKNVADFLQKAKTNNIYVYITLPVLPKQGGYYQGSDPNIEGENNFILTSGFIEGKKKYVKDFITGLASLNAPLDYVFGYSIENEAAFWEDKKPLSLNSGTITTANGQTYDMSKSGDKQAMMDSNLVYWINQVKSAVLEVDPTALVAAGFYAPAAVEGADKRIIRTFWALQDSDKGGSSADFVDLHSAPNFRSWEDEAKSFELIGNSTKKPRLMGETLAYKLSSYPFGYKNAKEASVAIKDWQVESCNYNFDGWLVWTWDTEEQPELYNTLSDNEEINNALSPVKRANPCSKENITPIPTVQTPTNTPVNTSVPTSAQIPTPTTVPCVISSASWGAISNPVVIGSTVNLNVQATGDCDNKKVNFEVRRNIVLQPDQPAQKQPAPNPVNLVSQSNNTYTASSTWTTEWVNSCMIETCNPEYFFNANIVGENKKKRSADPLLEVKKQVQNPQPTPTPTNIPTLTPVSTKAPTQIPTSTNVPTKEPTKTPAPTMKPSPTVTKTPTATPKPIFTIAPTIPSSCPASSPVNLSPSGNLSLCSSASSSWVTLRWKEVDKATYYNIRVSGNKTASITGSNPSNCSQADNEKYDICYNGWKSNAMTISVKPGVQYAWKIQAGALNCNVTSFSSSISFKLPACK